MGLFDFLKKQEESDTVADSEPATENYEEFMQGYRLGYPLEGEPSVTIENPSGEAFRHGLAEGQAEFEQAGRPVIRYEE